MINLLRGTVIPCWEAYFFSSH